MKWKLIETEDDYYDKDYMIKSYEKKISEGTLYKEVVIINNRNNVPLNSSSTMIFVPNKREDLKHE